MGIESGSSRLGVLVLAPILLLGGLRSARAASEAPDFELSGGYSFLSDRSDQPTNLPLGWYFSISRNLTDSIGVVADLGGNYKSEAGVSISEHALLGGARYSFRRERLIPYVEALAGAVLSGSSLGESAWDFAVQGGVGLGFKITDNAAVRAGFDFRNIFSEGTSFHQFRIVAGVTLGIGGQRETPPPPHERPGPGEAPPPVSPPTPRRTPPPAPPPAPEPTPAPRPAPAPEPARLPEAPARPPAAGLASSEPFARGRDLLRGGRYSEASDAFREHLRLHANEFTVAVGLYCEASHIAQMVQSSGAGEQLFVLRARRQGRICYGVYWGLFASRPEALLGLASLPASLRAGGETPIPVSRVLR